MEEQTLSYGCKNCLCLRQGLCPGRYKFTEIEKSLNGNRYELSNPLTAGVSFEGDDSCSKLLVTIDDDGFIYFNYKDHYQIGNLETITKKDVENLVIHLMDKGWFSITLLRVLIRRIFDLTGWTQVLEINVSRL